MAIRNIFLRGYGNGTFNGTIPLVVTRGYLPQPSGDPASIPGLEYTAQGDPLDYTAGGIPGHLTARGDPPQYSGDGGPLHYTDPSDPQHYTAGG